MSNYVAVKFVTGQEVMAEQIDNDDKNTVTLKRIFHVLPDPDDHEGKSMILSPFNAMVDPEQEVHYKRDHILSITEAYPALIDMMTNKFSSIIQPSAEASKISQLIL